MDKELETIFHGKGQERKKLVEYMHQGKLLYFIFVVVILCIHTKFSLVKTSGDFRLTK